jgi:CheY-like chemotaxis protein
MKVFMMGKEGPLVAALRTPIRISDGVVVKNMKEADVILAFSHREIENLWNRHPNKKFVVMIDIGGEKSKHQLPANVEEIFVVSAGLELVGLLGKLANSKKISTPSAPNRPPAPKGAPRVLVFDDTRKNIESAEQTVPFEYDLVTAMGYDEAMELLSKFSFDVVLTDLLTPMSSEGIIPDSFLLGKLVPYGLLILIEALAKGTKEVAIVTDIEGHCRDPFSAAIRHFIGEAVESGKTRLRFIQAPLRADGSKDWGKVLAG